MTSPKVRLGKLNFYFGVSAFMHSFLDSFMHSFHSISFMHSNSTHFPQCSRKKLSKATKMVVGSNYLWLILGFRTYFPRVLHPFIRYTPAPGVQCPKLRLQPLEVADLRLEHWSCRFPMGRRSLNFSTLKFSGKSLWAMKKNVGLLFRVYIGDDKLP